MKRSFLAGAGLVALALAAQPLAAADMPAAAPVYKAPVVAPVFDWTGFYGGIQGGYGWARTRISNADGSFSTSFSGRGWLLGGTLGYNVQSGSFVGGLEGDFSWANIKGTTRSCTLGCSTELQMLGTLRLRGGVTLTPTTLAYITGGAAYGRIENKVNTFASTRKTNKWGWTIGGGIETAFAGNWTGKIEYLYIDFGRTLACSVPPCGVTVNSDYLRAHIVRVGLNYRFAHTQQPVTARY